MHKINLNTLEQKQFQESLYYLKVTELKAIAVHCGLSSKFFNKEALINALVAYIIDGIIKIPVVMPERSKAQKGVSYPLALTTKMFFGSYKNDAKTRAFFKTVIGDYFHFTAFGIDWLNARWYAGDPPTYQEFSTYWKDEYARRKLHKVEPKKEWAYINFVQRCVSEYPSASQKEIIAAWQKERAMQVQVVMQLLGIKFQ